MNKVNVIISRSLVLRVFEKACMVASTVVVRRAGSKPRLLHVAVVQSGHRREICEASQRRRLRRGAGNLVGVVWARPGYVSSDMN